MRPKREDAIKARPWAPEQETIRSKHKGFGFYDAIDSFARCHHNTAFLVGLRAAGESPNRWRAVTKNPVEVGGKRVYWGTGREQGNVTFYPIYDWIFGDVWRYVHDEKLPYSKIYDMQLKKGYSVTEMRISSLTHERAFKSIVDLPEFEPKTYAKLLKRIKGIALAQERGKDAKLFACRKLPRQFKSWRTYRDFILGTYQVPEHKAIFAARFARHLDNEHVAQQQCRQLILADIENNCPVKSEPDPRDTLIDYYEANL
jgi:predicted phosphoadenosine phosphosulfate sulfurtransferase